MLNNIQIDQNQTIAQAIEKLNNLRNISRLILFVTNEKEQVIGSITDGDIRRFIIKHKDLDLSIKNACNTGFLYEYSGKNYIDFSTYKAKNIKIIPILDSNKKLIDIIDLNKQLAKLPLECMIMAGGRGKRLSPLTDTVPKPMLKLGGMPIIERNIDRLIQYGVKKIYISVKYLGEQIVEYFGDGSSKGISIEYIWEEKSLGTAGALSLVEQFQSDQILLMNSDLLTNVDFELMYTTLLNSNADMVVASTEYKVDIPYAIFETKGKNQVIDFKEKPSKVYHANAGIYILQKELVNRIPKNTFFDITDLMEELVKSGGKLIHCPIIGYWIDIGKPADFKQAEELIGYIKD